MSANKPPGGGPMGRMVDKIKRTMTSEQVSAIFELFFCVPSMKIKMLSLIQTIDQNFN